MARCIIMIGSMRYHSRVAAGQYKWGEQTFMEGGEMFISEQINRTRAKSQQIVVQDYSHAYNTPFFI